MNNPMLLLEQTPVSQLMTTRVEKVNASESVHNAVRKMVELNIGSLAVVAGDANSSDKIIGLLPVYQSLQHLLTQSQGRDVQVKDVMFVEHITIETDATISAALKKVTSNRSWRLIVVDKEGNSVGVLSATDIIKWLVEIISADSE